MTSSSLFKMAGRRFIAQRAFSATAAAPATPPTPAKASSTFLRNAVMITGISAAIIGIYLRKQEHAIKPLEFTDYQNIYLKIAETLEDVDHDDGSFGPILVRLAWYFFIFTPRHAAGTYDKESNTGGSDGSTMRFDAESKHGSNNGLKTARDKLLPIKQLFPKISYGMGFNEQEIVALSGAHALGRCHPSSSGYDGPWSFSPITLSNEYFKLLLSEKWLPRKWDGPLQYQDQKTKSIMMLPTDMALIGDKALRKYVELYAKDEGKFFTDFAAAFQKLEELGVAFAQGTEQMKFKCL